MKKPMFMGAGMSVDVEINAEQVNDLAKRGLHRLIARRLRRDPALMEKAHEEIERWRERYGERRFVSAWEKILEQESLEQIARRLTARTEEMTALRVSSPFARPVAPLLTEEERIRLWRTCRRILKSRTATSRT